MTEQLCSLVGFKMAPNDLKESAMTKIAFDPSEEGGLELARAVLMEPLRRDKNWTQLNSTILVLIPTWTIKAINIKPAQDC